MLRRTLRFLRWPLILAALLVLAIAGINLWMTLRCGDRIHTDPASVPQTDLALVLGTGKLTKDGLNNIHFRVRMDAAASLYKAQRVRHILVSGDNGAEHYNEPEDMKQALIERGVPASAITCDYAGFRTLDSIVRARDIFDVKECVIVSDDFHLARALWLADRHGIKATAYYEDAVRWGTSGKTRVREWFARVWAVADEIAGTEPKFGGQKEPIRLITTQRPMKIEVSVPDQKLRLYDGGAMVREYPCSTSKYGLGSEPESNFTPLGKFRIAHMIGHGAEPRTIFKSREVTGVWDGVPVEEDYVLTRILWLDGQEEHNANTRDRYIYIHGTNQEHLIGTPASHGCVRMFNDDVIDLFGRVGEGTEVEIRAAV